MAAMTVSDPDREFKDRLCAALGLDGAGVTRVVIDCSADALTRVYVVGHVTPGTLRRVADAFEVVAVRGVRVEEGPTAGPAVIVGG